MRAGIFTYAWDLAAEGHDQALGRISSAGFSSVNLACAYHAGKFLLPHNPKHRVYFPEDGAVYFQPEVSNYGRIRPRVSSLVDEKHDPLRDLDRERHGHGLDLVAWIVCLHNTWLGTKYPDCTVHNAFGDPILHSLSPAHPDVREYMSALVKDIVSNVDVTAIQLESPEYMGYEHGFHHEVTPVPLDDMQRLLLGLSFNPVELERARSTGIDAESLRQQVADALIATWNDPQSRESHIDGLMSNPDFEAYGSMLSQIESEFIAELRGAAHQARPETEVRLFAGMAASDVAATVPEYVSGNADGLLSGYAQSDESARDRGNGLKELMGDRPVYGMVRAISPDADQPEDAVSRIRAWKASGVDGIDVYNYGLMTLPMLEAVGNELTKT